MDKKKLKAAEEQEKIDAMGQESEHKAARWVKELGKEEEIKEKKRMDDKMEQLDDLRRRVDSYRRQLTFMLHDMIAEIRMSSLYQWGVWFDGRGVKIILIDKFGKKHSRAFEPSYRPKYDMNACIRFSQWVEDIYDRCEGNLAMEKGLWTPKIS